MDTTPDDLRRVDVRKLRKAVLKWIDEEESTYTEIARRIGWTRYTGQEDKPDYMRVQRSLGVRPCGSHGKKYYNRRITQRNALRIIEAIGLAPREFDL